MTSTEIASRLQQVFRHVFDMDDLVLERHTTAADVDDWDSLSHIQLIIAVEKEFEIKFRMAEIANLKEVGDMIDLLAKKLTAA